MTDRKTTRHLSTLHAAIAAMIVLMLAGCHPANSPRGVTDRFIDQHYVAINLDAAKQFCTGLALDKLDKEIALVSGQRIDDETRKPAVHYKLKAERTSGDHVEFIFRATIDVPEGGTFHRNWMITARLDGGMWKVSNYSEYD
jgi:hypothetical protein